MRTSALAIAVAMLIAAGCSRPAHPAAPPPSAPTPSAANPAMPSLTPTTPAEAAPSAATNTVPSPPPPGADTAAADAQANVTGDGPLEGKGRPLTPDEVSLLNYGVSMFKEEKGRFPRDLNEAVAAHYIRRLPQLPTGEHFQYDPGNGMIKVVKSN